jgi:hypothetical protein
VWRVKRNGPIQHEVFEQTELTPAQRNRFIPTFERLLQAIQFQPPATKHRAAILPTHHRTAAGPQFTHCEWLHQAVIRASFKAGNPGLQLSGVGRQNQHTHAVSQLARDFQHSHAYFAWKVQIQEKQVVVRAGDRCSGRRSVAYQCHRVIFLFERPRHKHSKGSFMFSNQDSQGHPSSQRRVVPACKDTISSNGPAWQDIALIFLRLYFAFGTPLGPRFILGTLNHPGEDFFATFRYLFARMAACPSHAGKKR